VLDILGRQFPRCQPRLQYGTQQNRQISVTAIVSKLGTVFDACTVPRLVDFGRQLLLKAIITHYLANMAFRLILGLTEPVSDKGQV
jgi:hypothetical protein